MLSKEYRICLPLTVSEYHVGQLYMVAKASEEQSEAYNEGVTVIENRAHSDPVRGQGQFTEKHIFPASRLPGWARAMVPASVFLVERSFNYYPYTETEYSCAFMPGMSIFIRTQYLDDAGTTENCFGLDANERSACSVDMVDIVNDPVAPDKYNEKEDLRLMSSKRGRGPFGSDWMRSTEPIMCAYKLIEVKVQLWGLQSRIENFIHTMFRELLLLVHRQSVAWIDEWIDMSVDDVRDYEAKQQKHTNDIMKAKDAK